jgi:hypothetical protein
MSQHLRVTVTTARARQGDASDGHLKPEQGGMYGPTPYPPRTKLLEARLASQSPSELGAGTMNTRRTVKAWAIDTGSSSHGFAGIFCFNIQAPPPWQNGCRTALFRTRQEARLKLGAIKGPKSGGLFPHARVVQVTVSVVTTA